MKLANLLSRYPLIARWDRRLRDLRLRLLGSLAGREAVFSSFYSTGKWGGRVSMSGPGSDREQTWGIEIEVPKLLRELSIRSMLDIPCGDFGWMCWAIPADVDYVGADIVTQLIAENRRLHVSGRIRFERLDLVTDPLPRVDMVFCRDCLVHLSYRDIVAALCNIGRSGARYLAMTTYPKFDDNFDIVTGRWRRLNFQAPPFGFPAPIKLVQEGSTEKGGAYADKSIGVWSVEEIVRCISQSPAQLALHREQ